MTTVTCHPDRPHLARGLCAACYKIRWRAVRRLRARQQTPCTICGRPFTPRRLRAKYCSKTCQVVSISWRHAERRGTRPDGEELYATRDRAFAAEIVRSARGRGCVRIKPNAPGAQCSAPHYYSAWHRGGGLYLVRVRWPVEQSEVAA